MAAAQLNPTRRSLLGAAVGSSLVPDALTASFRRTPESTCLAREEERWIPDQVRDDEQWQSALAAFEAAAAEVRAIEAATAGYRFEEEEAVLPAHDAACAAMEAALQRMLFVPAPHLGALGIKFEAAFAHELASAVQHGELRFPAIMQDILRLHGAQRRVEAAEGQSTG
ncbi:MAG TPA: hypothetical protein VEA61_13865 [Allosphingosinicella sp.]|nr:hypothetical protein [Allosphingosinicella sp.]